MLQYSKINFNNQKLRVSPKIDLVYCNINLHLFYSCVDEYYMSNIKRSNQWLIIFVLQCRLGPRRLASSNIKKTNHFPWRIAFSFTAACIVLTFFPNNRARGRWTCNAVTSRGLLRFLKFVCKATVCVFWCLLHIHKSRHAWSLWEIQTEKTNEASNTNNLFKTQEGRESGVNTEGHKIIFESMPRICF